MRCSKCHLSPDPQYFVVPFAVMYIKIEIYKLWFACCFIWVWHFVSYKLREEHGPNVRVGPQRKELTGDWLKLWWATLWFVILTRYSLSYQIKEDKMGGMCSMCGRKGTNILNYFGGTSEGKTLLWRLGIGGRLTLKNLAYRYPPNVAFYVFFSTTISTEYFKHAAHSVFLFQMPFIL
jgi:hypothetical protein